LCLFLGVDSIFMLGRVQRICLGKEEAVGYWLLAVSGQRPAASGQRSAKSPRPKAEALSLNEIEN
jgi:hypothetical protein